MTMLSFDASAAVCRIIDKAQGKCGGNKFIDLEFQPGCPSNPNWTMADCCALGAYGPIKETCDGQNFYERCKTLTEYCLDYGYDIIAPTCSGGQEAAVSETCPGTSYKKWTCKCPASKPNLVNGACATDAQWCANNGFGVPNCGANSSYSGGTACEKDGSYKKGGACECGGEYSLTSCPANGSCTTCQSGGTTKYSLNSCNSGYSMSGNSCAAVGTPAPSGCGIAYKKPNGTKEILSSYIPSRKSEIVGIYIPVMKQVVGLVDYGRKTYYDAVIFASTTEIDGLQCQLPSCIDEYRRSVNYFYMDRACFDDTAAFLRSNGVNADNWNDYWYWCRETYDGSNGNVFNLSGGIINLNSKTSNNNYARCVLAF